MRQEVSILRNILQDLKGRRREEERERWNRERGNREKGREGIK